METESKQVLMNLAVMHYKAGRYEKAIEECEKALAIDHYYLRAYHGIARSLTNLHRYKEALDIYDRIIAREQNNSEIYKQRGDVHYEMRDYVSASNDYYRAVALDPKNEEATRKKELANKYCQQRREQWGGVEYDYNDEWDEDGPRYKYIPYDYEREEWEAEIIEYAQDWEMYTGEYN